MSGALAVREDQDYWDDKQLAVLRSTGIDQDVTKPELASFLHECQRRELDPFTRQIYLIGRFDRRAGRKVYRSQTSIDGFRLIARRAADAIGVDYSYEDTIWFDADGGRHEVWLSAEPPAAAKVVVVRNGNRFDGVARFGAYVVTGKEGKPQGLWATMPDTMIAKCAEAQALRKAFPEDLGGIYTDEEMGQDDETLPGSSRTAAKARRTAKRRPLQPVETPEPELDTEPVTAERAAAAEPDLIGDEDWPEPDLIPVPGGSQ